METIYWTIAGLGLLLCLFVFLAYKLKKNRPNIKPELELFPVPEKKPKAVFIPLVKTSIPPDRIVIDRSTPYRGPWKKCEEKELFPKQIEQAKEFFNNLENNNLPPWFELQKRKALRQLRQFKFNKLEFIPEWTFEEDNQILKTQGYLLDASNTLNDVVNQLLINKQRVIFWLSPESDGIYHKRVISGGNKTEANVTIQVWSTPI